MPQAAKPFGFWIDFAQADPHTGSPTFDGTTTWHDHLEIPDLSSFARDQHAANTGLAPVANVMAPGAWNFEVQLTNIRPTAAKRTAWNNGVKAGTGWSWKWIEDRTAAASATNMQITGSGLGFGLITSSTVFGGIVEVSLSLMPAWDSTEPWISVVDAATVAFGDNA